MSGILLRLLGWRATVIYGDPCEFDRWVWLRRHIQSPGIRTLDAGCGNGSFSIFSRIRGNDSVGISNEESELETAKEQARMLELSGITFRLLDLKNLEDVRAELGDYDQVICFETIEHILDDDKLVRNLAGLLKPGGRLLLTTPHKHYRRLRGDRLSETEDGGHVRWGYTHNELQLLFAKHNLDLVVAEEISGIVSQSLTNLYRIAYH